MVHVGVSGKDDDVGLFPAALGHLFAGRREEGGGQVKLRIEN
jgi:hypothetical protein